MKYLSYILLALFFSTSNTDPIEKSFVMVQLFTSQGCSSCPPADKLIEEIKDEYQDQNVYILSYHVDYWNRLGWKDPFSSKEFTQLQYDYADQFRERNVYTPQIVINGKEHFIGSNESKLRKRIKTYLNKKPENTIQLSSTKDTYGNILLNYEVTGDVINKKLKLAFVLENSTTKIKRGENKNRTVTNTNIVLKEIVLDLDRDQKGSITIPNTSSEIKKDLTFISFIQNEKLQITGAAQFEL